MFTFGTREQEKQIQKKKKKREKRTDPDDHHAVLAVVVGNALGQEPKNLLHSSRIKFTHTSNLWLYAFDNCRRFKLYLPQKDFKCETLIYFFCGKSTLSAL